jgi:hypothetical protein
VKLRLLRNSHCFCGSHAPVGALDGSRWWSGTRRHRLQSRINARPGKGAGRSSRTTDRPPLQRPCRGAYSLPTWFRWRRCASTTGYHPSRLPARPGAERDGTGCGAASMRALVRAPEGHPEPRTGDRSSAPAGAPARCPHGSGGVAALPPPATIRRAYRRGQARNSTSRTVRGSRKPKANHPRARRANGRYGAGNAAFAMAVAINWGWPATGPGNAFEMTATAMS